MEENKYMYAGMLQRIGAFCLDCLLLLLLNSLFYFCLHLLGLRVTPEKENPLVSILLLLFNWLYFCYFETSQWQGTPGKIIYKIKIINIKGKTINWKTATQRFVLAFLTLFTLFIGFFIAWKDDKRQAIHDRFTKTFVVKNEERKMKKKQFEQDSTEKE